MSTESRILVVDDERNIRRTLKMVLEGEGYHVDCVGTLSEATTQLSANDDGRRYDVVVLDVMLGDGNGVEYLRDLRTNRGANGPSAAQAEVPVIMISGHAAIDDAVAATRLGAYDFLEKPLDRTRVVLTLRNALERSHLLREVGTLRKAVDSRYELLGHSQPMQALRRQIAKVAPTRSRVLITGDSGTGKELIARAIHHNSAVASRAFVKVNCAAIPAELIESELFGHERGAFTGAVSQKRGLFEIADGGTIFLDEVGDMSLSAQAKVLRVLQTGELARVGGEHTFKVECRVIAATNRDLENMVKTGEFREDLFFRLSVFPIYSPKLDQRTDDIPLLAEAFVRECCDDNGFSYKPISDDVLEQLQKYSWPGNVRELRNVIERLVIMADDIVVVGDLPPYLTNQNSEDTQPDTPDGLDPAKFDGYTLRDFRENAERQFIRYQLGLHKWNISRTAQALGIERTNLHKKLRALGIKRVSGEQPAQS